VLLIREFGAAGKWRIMLHFGQGCGEKGGTDETVKVFFLSKMMNIVIE